MITTVRKGMTLGWSREVRWNYLVMQSLNKLRYYSERITVIDIEVDYKLSEGSLERPKPVFHRIPTIS